MAERGYGDLTVQQQMAQILDGKLVAAQVRDRLKSRVEELVRDGHRLPGLAVVLIGDNPASHVYVKNKIQACKKVGIESRLYQFPSQVGAQEVYACLGELNRDTAVDGILVQLPLPGHLPTDSLLAAVLPGKDVDGLHPQNLGLLLSGKPGLRPCTPQGIMVLLEHYHLSLAGKRAVVIGRSNLVGKPIAMMLLEKNATVTICHSKSERLDEIARTADVLVVAAGKECLVRGAWIKPGAVVVDVGIHKRAREPGADVNVLQEEAQLVGDVDFQESARVASYITPVPGGVGPMTVAMLLSNTLIAYQEHIMLRDGRP